MVDVSGTVVVAVLTRSPSSGGKTRLFQALGRSPDPDLLRALFLDTLDAAELPGTARVVCHTPPGASEEMRALVPDGVALLPQRTGDLGQRMQSVFDDLFALGAASVILIGSDLPSLPRAALVAARDALIARPAAVVIGPARDGGYFLVGATSAAAPAAMLAAGGWGGPDVFARALSAAKRECHEVVLLPEESDVDTVEDLRRTATRSDGGIRTRAWARRHLGTTL
jgi:hypothetical protein